MYNSRDKKIFKQKINCTKEKTFKKEAVVDKAAVSSENSENKLYVGCTKCNFKNVQPLVIFQT